jgi:hypothetical protein
MSVKIESPGQFYDRVIDAFRQSLTDKIEIVGYDDVWDREIAQPCLVVQFEDAHPGTRQTTGRYEHRYMLTAHCVIPTSRPRANIDAVDLAAEVERQLDLNRFGIAPECIGAPEIQVNGDTSYLFGFDGIVARGVQWIQPLYLGHDYFGADEERGSVWLAVNPSDPDDRNQYGKIWPKEDDESAVKNDAGTGT